MPVSSFQIVYVRQRERLVTVEARLYAMWQALVRSLSVASAFAEEAWQDVVFRYGENGRYYHTLTHVDHVLEVAESVREQIDDWTAVQLAVWFHDIVYNPQAEDNEEKSALYAWQLLQKWQLSSDVIYKVSNLILATKAHISDDQTDLDCLTLLDADLAILGVEPARYCVYAEAIRQEYKFVPEIAYKIGRAKVLEAFLNRPQIYRTPTLHRRLETAARVNLTVELADISR